MAFYVPSLTNKKITKRPGESTFVHNLVVYERKYWHNIRRYATQYEVFGYRKWPFPTRLQQVKTYYIVIYITLFHSLVVISCKKLSMT